MFTKNKKRILNKAVIGCIIDAVKLIIKNTNNKHFFNLIIFKLNSSINKGSAIISKDRYKDNPLEVARAVGKPQSAILYPKKIYLRYSD